MFLYVPAVTTAPGLCIFCFAHERDCAPGSTCSYDMRHEFVPQPVKTTAPGTKRHDAKLCTKCNVHPKNPLSATNGCEHVYPEAM